MTDPRLHDDEEAAAFVAVLTMPGIVAGIRDDPDSDRSRARRLALFALFGAALQPGPAQHPTPSQIRLIRKVWDELLLV